MKKQPRQEFLSGLFMYADLNGRFVNRPYKHETSMGKKGVFSVATRLGEEDKVISLLYRSGRIAIFGD